MNRHALPPLPGSGLPDDGAGPPELAAASREEMFGLLADSLRDHAICLLDAQGRVANWNRGVGRILGYVPQDIVGRSFSQFFAPETGTGNRSGELLRHALAAGRSENECWLVRDGGTRFWARVVLAPIRDEQQVLRGFSLVVQDETGRRRFEDMLRSVVDHVIDGIITIDSGGSIESFNPAAEKLFGYLAAEVIGQNVKLLMPEPYRKNHDAYVDNYLRTGQAKIIGLGREVVGQRKDGSTFPMELAVSEFQISGRRYFTGIVRDITERKRLEDELRQRVAELAEADHQKDNFLAMLAHELRNPLAPMRNALHLMKMQGATPRVIEKAREMMQRQLEHLIRLVDDLLDVSRIIQGRIELRREPVDLAVVVARAVETAQPVIDARGHELEVSLPDPSLHVEGDLVRLSQVVANLLTNAAKYTDTASSIVLSLVQEGGEAVLRVRDLGVGISPELQTRIFDLFVQGDITLARSQGGLGIGLTLVKRIVAMHGGRVSVSSEGPGRGSEFVVRLPVIAGSAAQGAPTPSRRAHVTDALRKRVLVVDDNVDAAESIAMILRAAGYDVRCAYDGFSGLEAAEEHRPDVAVLDIGLPGMSGYEIAMHLRRDPKLSRTALVALTGYGLEADRRRSKEAGFDHHLTKPVDPEALQALVAAMPAEH